MYYLLIKFTTIYLCISQFVTEMPAQFPEVDLAPPSPAMSMTNNNETANRTCIGFCHDDLVISGISCRLPESENMEEFSDNLFNGVDMITDDGRRWSPGLFG